MFEQAVAEVTGSGSGSRDADAEITIISIVMITMIIIIMIVIIIIMSMYDNNDNDDYMMLVTRKDDQDRASESLAGSRDDVFDCMRWLAILLIHSEISLKKLNILNIHMS